MSTGPDSTARKKQARDLFQRGNDAATKGNYEYAAQMYRDACKLDPEELPYRQSLRGVARKKFNNDPSKVGRMVGLSLQTTKMKIGSLKKKGKWAEAIELCEEAFLASPWDTSIAMDAAEAAENLGLKKVAQYFVESVFAQGEKDHKFLRFAAHIEELAEDWKKAIICWEKVKAILPHDEDARRRINDITARAAIQRSGLDQSLGKHAAVSGPEKDAPPDPDEIRRNSVTPEQRYLAEIQENPERIGSYLSLAEDYRNENRLEDAEKILARGLKAVPDNPYIRSAYAEVQIARLRHAVEVMTQKVAKDPTDSDKKEKLEQFQTALYNYEVKELKRKIGLQADDANLRFELGKLLARGGRHDEAIAEFQQARNSPELKVHALLQAGLSFQANGSLRLAERNLQEALRLAAVEDIPTINELHYNLGCLAQAQGNLAIAEEHFNEVAANDYSYKDVAERLRNLSKKEEPED
ncbi:tetratricopeptide repeat protein [Tundrisphaera sp. TA3]|uniref:tetratricopeptide repeat protein n=1 Tax=Tundrisphaera sp. TA3 TaxID=3435775 RepID=UPI003EBC8CA2